MRLVALVVALYAVWRVAVVLGKRREKARRTAFPIRGPLDPVRCRRCGRIAESAEMTSRGLGPWRVWECREGCLGDTIGEHGHAV